MPKIITYDLLSPGQNYSKLIETIRAYPGWCKITESCWIVSSKDDCEKIRNNLMKHMDSNDRILVAELTGVAAWANVMCDGEVLKRVLSN